MIAAISRCLDSPGTFPTRPRNWVRSLQRWCAFDTQYWSLVLSPQPEGLPQSSGGSSPRDPRIPPPKNRSTLKGSHGPPIPIHGRNVTLLPAGRRSPISNPRRYRAVQRMRLVGSSGSLQAQALPRPTPRRGAISVATRPSNTRTWFGFVPGWVAALAISSVAQEVANPCHKTLTRLVASRTAPEPGLRCSAEFFNNLYLHHMGSRRSWGCSSRTA